MMDAITAALINAATVLVSLFPNANITITENISEFMTTFRSGLVMADAFIPVNYMLTCMGLILTVETALFSFKLYRWIASNVSLGIFK